MPYRRSVSSKNHRRFTLACLIISATTSGFAAETVAPRGTKVIAPQPVVPGDVALVGVVNDTWVARQAINKRKPLRDPSFYDQQEAAQKQAEETARIEAEADRRRAAQQRIQAEQDRRAREQAKQSLATEESDSLRALPGLSSETSDRVKSSRRRAGDLVPMPNRLSDDSESAGTNTGLRPLSVPSQLIPLSRANQGDEGLSIDSKTGESIASPAPVVPKRAVKRAPVDLAPAELAPAELAPAKPAPQSSPELSLADQFVAPKGSGLTLDPAPDQETDADLQLNPSLQEPATKASPTIEEANPSEAVSGRPDEDALSLDSIEPDNFVSRAERRRTAKRIESATNSRDEDIADEKVSDEGTVEDVNSLDSSSETETATEPAESSIEPLFSNPLDADGSPNEFDNEGELSLETPDSAEGLPDADEADAALIKEADQVEANQLETESAEQVEPISDRVAPIQKSGRLPTVEVIDPIEELRSVPSLDSVKLPANGFSAGETAATEIDAQTIRSRQDPTSLERDFTGHVVSGDVKPSTAASRMQLTMQACMKYYFDRPEVATGRSNWGLMHSIMVYGIDTKVVVGRKKYSAIAWMAGNNVSRGQRILSSRGGRLSARSGVGLQGHQGQLLAVLSLTGVPRDYPLYAEGTRFAVKDLIKAEAVACKSGEELTFTLIGLSHYMSTDATWVSSDGQQWDFERLIREELSQPVVGAACGGTHRLMGFAHALRMRRAEGLPITGQWARAQKFMDDFETYAYRLQNRDGSMSTNWFEGRQDNGKMDRKVQTTGHIVEWLLTITPDDQLDDPRLVRSIQYLTNAMYKYRSKDWSIGPKGHALRSIALYHERVFGSSAWGARDAEGQRVTRLTTSSLR